MDTKYFCSYCGREQEVDNPQECLDRVGAIVRCNYQINCQECGANSKVIIDFRHPKSNTIYL